MTAIVEKVLSMDTNMTKAASSYIDDIMVNEEELPVEKVVHHLDRFGLTTKEPQRLGGEEDVCVLGLKVAGDSTWTRDAPLPGVDSKCLTRRQVHQLVGEWVGHFPVAGWLRVACGFLQWCTTRDQVGWDDNVNPAMFGKVMDVVNRLHKEGDPVYGHWQVDMSSQLAVWVDASSLAMGAAIEIGGSIVEDAAWLRTAEDVTHINLSELEAAIKGINLACKWGLKCFTLFTDSATVHGWLKSVFAGTHNVRTKAMSELLVK